jgi:hypothetical protein
MRRPTVSTWLALLVLALSPSWALAGGIASYRLTDTDVAGAPPVSTVLMSVVPAGSVAPTDPSVSPLTILDGSSGFDPNALQVFLGSGTTPAGAAFQALKLDFGSAGLQPGGRLYFSLNLANSYQGSPPLLILPSTVSNIAIESIPNPGGNGSGGGSGSPPNTPEPLPILLWASVGGLGLLRARAFRRAQARTV